MLIGLTWGAAFLLVWLPGLLLERAFRLPRHPDWLVRLALQMGVGIAFWPLLFLWTSLLGWRWSPGIAQAFVLLLGLLGIFSIARVPALRWQQRLAHLRRQGLGLTFFAAIFAITAITRLVQIRTLALPAWVDSVHHTMIIRLLVAQGQIPATFDPLIPGGVFNYHWGYHALMAWLAWLLRRSDAFDLADLVLHAGQFLNALSVLMLYAAGRSLFASRRAGLLTAALVGTVSWFPAYYLSWGRYTHLTGLLLLPVVVICLWRLRHRPTWGGMLAASLTLAGLALIHVRIAYFAATLMALLAVVFLVRGRWRPLLLWGGAATFGFLLTLPWWLSLMQSAWVRTMLAVRTESVTAWAETNSVDWGLMWTPRTPPLVTVATLGLSALAGWGTSVRLTGLLWLCLVVGLGFFSFRRRSLWRTTRRTALAWGLLLAWSLLTALLLQLDRLGLPYTLISHINAWVITLFVPLSLAVGGLAAWALGFLTPPRWALSAAGLLALLLSIGGASGMTTIVNPETVLATQADRAALHWIRQNTPPDAYFAVQAWPWLSGIYAGSDGGYWISVLTDRRSILPPSLYASALPPAAVQPIRDLLSTWHTAASLDDPTLRQRLREAGVTHLYIGSRPGILSLESLLTGGYVELIYEQDGVFIFALKPEARGQGEK